MLKIYINKFNLIIITLVVSLIAYCMLAYHTNRSDANEVVLWFSTLFVGYFLLIKYGTGQNNLYITLIIAAFLFRLLLLLQIPNLSDDFWRFIFDGKLVAHGINPYTILPSKYILSADVVKNGIDFPLYQQLNSPNYYSVYPALLQYIFGVSSFISNDNEFLNIIYLRLFILLSEIGSFFLLTSILKKLKLQKELAFIYFLNPLVIIELTGNLHFEAVMIFFLLLSIYFFSGNQLINSAIALSLSIATKLIPLLFIPLICVYLGWKKGLYYSSVTFACLVLLFIPFMNAELIGNIFSSIGLYFHTFEFNASLFYLIKVGLHSLVGLDSKQVLRVLLPATSLSLIVFVAWNNKAQRMRKY